MPAPSGRRAARLACCLLLLTFALPCAAQEPTTPAPKSHQQGFIVPFTPVSGQGAPLVTVWINSQVEATFVVDTGTNNCLISQSLVKKLGLTPFPALLSNGKPLLLESKQPQAVILTSLQLGGKQGPLVIHEPKMPVCVLPDQQLRVSASQLVDGLIGSNLLFNFAVDFDFSAHTMLLCLPGNLTQGETKFLKFNEPGGTALPLLDNSNNVYSVQVRLDNNSTSRQVDLLLDTGSQTTTVPRRAALDLSLVPLGKIPQANHSGSYYTVQVVRPQALTLGDLRLQQPSVNYSDNPDCVPRLGLDILSSYRVLIDFPAKKMYLQPAEPTIKIAPPVAKP